MRHSSQPFAAPFLCGHIAVLAASSALSPIIPFYLQQSLAELWRAGSNLTCSLLPPSSCSPSALHRVYSTNRLLLPKQKQRRWATQHNAGCVYQLKNEAISACMYKDLFFFFFLLTCFHYHWLLCYFYFNWDYCPILTKQRCNLDRIMRLHDLAPWYPCGLQTTAWN